MEIPEVPLAAPFRLPGSIALTDEGKKAIIGAFRDEIRRLLDKENSGAAELLTIAKIANQARLFADGTMPQLTDAYGAGSSLLGGAIAPAPTIETIGAQALRELVSALPEVLKAMKPKPFDAKLYAPPEDLMEDLVNALAAAKREGMHDLVAKIQEKLLRRFEDPKPAPPMPEDAPLEPSPPPGQWTEPEPP